MKRGQFLYDGKAKTIYEVEGDSEKVWQEFKNSLTAFNGVKRGDFSNKGELNRQITSKVFSYLSKHKISNHWVADIDKNVMVTEKLKIFPIEVVVRNKAAGSLAKKFGWSEGLALENPLVEFYFKNDELGDPFISDDQAILLKAATLSELGVLKKMGLQINEKLKVLFSELGLDLIDFKLEFGKNSRQEILLGDEITPDTCRLWDKNTGEKMDKDRFRRDLGNIQGAYEAVYERLKGIKI